MSSVGCNMNTTWIRYPHTVEIWEKSITVNAAGQRLPNYEHKQTVPCFFIPISSRDRQSPTYENRNRDQLYIPPRDFEGHQIVITYDTRFRNIRDRTQEVLRGDSSIPGATSSAEFHDVDALIKHTGWAGKIRFYQIVILTSVEP